MMVKKEIYINDLRVEAYDYLEETIQSEPTGNQLRKISLKVNLVGEHKQKELSDILDEIFEVTTSEGVSFKAKKENTTWTYNGQVLNMATPISYYIEAVELDKELPEDHNALAIITSTVIMNWIRTRAISELLIDKGIIAYKEYEDTINKIADRDFENLRKYIAYGIREEEKERE